MSQESSNAVIRARRRGKKKTMKIIYWTGTVYEEGIGTIEQVNSFSVTFENHVDVSMKTKFLASSIIARIQNTPPPHLFFPPTSPPFVFLRDL